MFNLGSFPSSKITNARMPELLFRLKTKVYIKPSRKNQDFLFSPLPPVPVWLKIRYLNEYFLPKYIHVDETHLHLQFKYRATLFQK